MNKTDEAKFAALRDKFAALKHVGAMDRNDAMPGFVAELPWLFGLLQAEMEDARAAHLKCGRFYEALTSEPGVFSQRIRAKIADLKSWIEQRSTA